jgi:hypothetical protein
MRNIAVKWLSLFAATFAFIFLANPLPAATQDDDPPARAARLSYAQGAVSFEPAGTDDWVDAIVNRPMTSGDKLWADRDGRAEIRIDSYAIRLGPQTGFSFLNLDDSVVQVRLTEGSLNVRVRRLDDNQTLEIDTPNLAFNVLRPGSYRIDVNENGDATLVTVRTGQGEVTGGGSAYPIRAGQSANFSGTDELYADVQGIADDDDFDQWSNTRDRRWEHSDSARYVSDDAVGYEDLDESGEWRAVPEYGTIWFPRDVAQDWAPYRYGHWVWVSPWGWTWVDDAPWGFAPFHYGRWVVAGGRWGWVPSPPRPRIETREYVRPVYAPALVAWVGGSHFGVGVAVGGAPSGVAWFPLGPRDVYTPSYHVSERYVQRVNVSNTVIVNRTQVTNVYNNVYVNKTVNVTNVTYQNQRANNAVTATSQASFTTAQPVGRNQVRVDAREVASAPVAPMTMVAPQQRSFAGAGTAARARPPANVVNRNVVAKTAPPPAPVPVAQQVQAVQANGGRPVAATQIRANQPEPARANVKVAAPAKAAVLPPTGQSQQSRPGEPAQPSARNRNNGQPAQANQPNQPAAAQPANRPANENPNQPNANRPANVNPNTPTQDNRDRVNPNQPNPNRPANANPNTPTQDNRDRVNPNQPNANRPANANPNTPTQDNRDRVNPNQPNPNRPANANPNTPTQDNRDRVNPNQPNPNRPANANPNTPAQDNRDRVNPNQPNPNRPANANPNNPTQDNRDRPNPNQPNANRPPDANSTTNPNANRPAVDPQTQQRQQQQADQLRQQQQQERQRADQQRAPQQQKLEQQKADQPKQQEVQKQQQQQQQKEVQKKEQQNAKPPKKDNKDNKDDKDKKDRPPSR